MRIELVVDGVPYDLILDREEDTVRVEADGETYEADVRRVQDGPFEVTLGKRTISVDVGSTESGRVDGKEVSFRVARFDPTGAAGVGPGADGLVRPPMPGSIARLLVKKGDKVDKGAPLAVLEAMKMQNEITAPVAGVIHKLNAKTGDAVTLSDVVMEIEVEE